MDSTDPEIKPLRICAFHPIFNIHRPL